MRPPQWTSTVSACRLRWNKKSPGGSRPCSRCKFHPMDIVRPYSSFDWCSLERPCSSLVSLNSFNLKSPVRDVELEELDRAVEYAMDCWAIPGLSITVVQGGDVVFLEGYDVGELDRRTPITPDRQFMIRSLTKSITAAGIASLVAEKRLDWNTWVREIQPEFQLQDPAATETITVSDLLAHVANFPATTRYGHRQKSARERGCLKQCVTSNQATHCARRISIQTASTWSRVWSRSGLAALVARGSRRDEYSRRSVSRISGFRTEQQNHPIATRFPTFGTFGTHDRQHCGPCFNEVAKSACIFGFCRQDASYQGHSVSLPRERTGP
jgi:hypothetical protein